jgi:peptidyl-prolyl cis-trans isomerase D
MVPEFEKAAFSMPPGQISGIVKSNYGYHIIKVEDKHEARLKPLEEVRSKVESEVAGGDARQEAESLAAKVSNSAGSKGLDAAAAENHLEVTPSDWFARTDSLPGIGNAPEFMGAVFGAKEKSPPSEVGISTGYVVFQLAGVKPPVPPTYEDVRDKVLTDYKQEQTNTLVYKKAQELSNRAHTLNDLTRAAKELGAKLESTSEFKGPNDQVPDLGSLRGGASVAFSMKQGEISSPIRAGSNNAAVFTLLDRQEPTPADFAKSGDQIRETLLEQKRGEIFQLYAEGLKQTLQKEGKIKVNQQELDTYTKRAPETSYNY